MWHDICFDKDEVCLTPQFTSKTIIRWVNNVFGEQECKHHLIKKIVTITTTIVLTLAYYSASAADNAVTFEAATTNNGTGNPANINSSEADKIASIYQAGSGDRTGATEKNQVGEEAGTTLILKRKLIP